MKLASLLGLALLACGGQTESTHSSDEHDVRFVGTWVVEDPTLDAIHGQAWQLGADGSMTVIAEESVLDTFGAVERAGTRCRFADRWSSEGPETLRVAVRCTDATPRTLALLFSSNASQNAIDAAVAIRDVDGQSGWTRPKWSGWAMRKCAGAAACLRP